MFKGFLVVPIRVFSGSDEMREERRIVSDGLEVQRTLFQVLALRSS